VILTPLLDRAQLSVDEVDGQAAHGEAVEQTSDHWHRVRGDQLELQARSLRFADLMCESVRF